MSIDLSSLQLETVKELMNVGVNESTNLLSKMLNVEIELTIPIIKFINSEDLIKELGVLGSGDLSAVNMEFKNGFSGLSQLVFTQDSANKLVNVFSKEVLDIEGLDELKAGALVEIGNLILNAVMAEFSNFFKHEFEFYVPSFFENYKNDFFSQVDKFIDNVVLIGQTLFTIEELEISGDIVIFLKIESFNTFISLIDEYLSKF